MTPMAGARRSGSLTALAGRKAGVRSRIASRRAECEAAGRRVAATVGRAETVSRRLGRACFWGALASSVVGAARAGRDRRARLTAALRWAPILLRAARLLAKF